MIKVGLQAAASLGIGRCCCLLIVSWLLALPARSQGSDLPPFDPAPCPFPGGDALSPSQAQCGYLTVPARRAEPHGPHFRLAVLRMPSWNRATAADPVIFVTGGPGFGALEGGALWQSHPLRAERELILFDLRGTGYSEPRVCRDHGARVLETMAADLKPEQERLRRSELALECQREAARRGIDLAALDTAEVLSDLEDLRLALGIQSWNLLGLSYGSKLAVAYAREHPERVRSLVLDGVLPPEADLHAELEASANAAWQELLTACARDADCRASSPRLDETLRAALLDLRNRPLRLTRVGGRTLPAGGFFLNEQDAVLIVQQSLYDRHLITHLPNFVAALAARETEVVAEYLDRLGSTATALSFPLYFGITCRDQVPFSRFDRAPTSTGPLSQLTFFSADLEVCPRLGLTDDIPRRAAPERLETPALLFAGELDPITPPAYASAMAAMLPSSFEVRLPGHGHGGSLREPCARQETALFLAQPQARPVTPCAQQRTAIDFPQPLAYGDVVRRLARSHLAEPRLALALSLLALLLVLVAGSVVWSVELLRRRRLAEARGLVTARGVGLVTALTGLVSLAGILGAVTLQVRRDPIFGLFGVPASWAWPFQVAQLLPWLVGAMLVCAFLLRRNGQGKARPWRTLYNVVLAAAMGAVVWLGAWNVL